MKRRLRKRPKNIQEEEEEGERRGGRGEKNTEEVGGEKWIFYLLFVKDLFDHRRLEEPCELGQEDTIPEVVLKLGDRGQLLVQAHLNPPKKRERERKKRIEPSIP